MSMLMLGVSFTSCSDDDDDSKKNDEGSKVRIPENSISTFGYEGSYQKNNAGITYYDPDKRNNVIDDVFYKRNEAKLVEIQDKI